MLHQNGSAVGMGHALRRALLAGTAAMSVAAGNAVAQDPATEAGLKRYREMMKADPWANPAMLDVDRGEDLWKKPGGPKNVSLETCDLGLGAGKLDGAFAQMPRYFADADRVMDAETRLLWCMEKIQGHDPAKLTTRPHPGGGAPVKDLGALATFVASKSNGKPFAAPMDHAKEKETLKLGEALFFRRMGPMDFACSTCHADSGKRIRLQPLPYLSKAEEAKQVVGEWPAYRVSSTHVMTMQHRIYDCFWQMRLPEVELGSEATVALISYLVQTAKGGEVSAPGMKR
jgi:L-cysteine S-thiosulfotransferase